MEVIRERNTFHLFDNTGASLRILQYVNYRHTFCIQSKNDLMRYGLRLTCFENLKARNRPVSLVQ